jgi:DsbC/DsbD-like thiol-disulfide interchange protein
MHVYSLGRYRPEPRLLLATGLAALSLVTAITAGAESVPESGPQHVAITAFADHESVGPGDTFWVAVAQQIEPGWHTYWINPGDAGEATTLTWTLPPGYEVGEVQWPVPRVFRAQRDVTYGYDGEVVLLQQVRAPAALPTAPASLAVEAHWLVCKEVCLPEHARTAVAVRQVATAPGLAAAHARALFNAARRRLPRPAPWPASLRVGPSNLELTLHGAAGDLRPGSPVHFVPRTWGAIDNAAVQRPEWTGADLVLGMTRGDLREAPLPLIDGVLVVGPASARRAGRGYDVHAVAVDPGASR